MEGDAAMQSFHSKALKRNVDLSCFQQAGFPTKLKKMQ